MINPKITTWFVAVTLFVVSSTTSPASAAPYDKTPAGITDAARDSTYADFMRMLWVPPGTQVTYFGRHDSAVTNLRAFFTASTFIKPSMTVDQYSALVGNNYQTDNDVVFMRCKLSPEQMGTISPILASWPNVFSAIVSDFQGHGYSCPPNPNDGNNVMFCAAQDYHDSQEGVFVNGLQNAMTIANLIFKSVPGPAALKSNYGIYPAFTGLGFAAAGSGTVGSMSTSQILRESIVPEYLLMNATLADAGCRCIQVAKYGNKQTDDVRHDKPVDPNYVWQKGKLQSGACHQIARLGSLVSTLNAAADQSSSAAAEAP